MFRNTLFALATLALPMAARAQVDGPAASPSRPDLNRPTQEQPASDQKPTDINNDRGVDQKKTGRMGAEAQRPAEVQPQQQAGLTDEELFARLHHVNIAEVELGGVAQQRGQMAEVKSFGRMMAR